jgi:hypothetical protein
MMIRRLASAALAVAALTLVAVPPAGAAANTGASCLGIGSAGNAGYPRDRAVISHDVKHVADALDVASGALISDGARHHLGSAAACFG